MPNTRLPAPAVLGAVLGAIMTAGAAGMGARAESPAVPPGFDASVCKHIVRHRPAPDVEYIPGVDVRGRPVAPADLPGSSGAAALERFDIPLTLDLARRLGVPAPGVAAGAGIGSMEIGRLTIDGGRVLVNGRPIGGRSEAELREICRNLP